MITSSIRDVEKQLPQEPNYRHPAGEVISPLTYTNDLLNFDCWDYMFIKNCCKSLTLYNFNGPPSTILDLGCGCGLWAIEAAKQWQDSTIVGFDVNPVQPKLSMLDDSSALGCRLNKLPFLDGQFNFVRRARMGLHIPEDEWGYILAEISRVLAADSILEIIEKDLIFPSQSLCLTIPTSGQSSEHSPPHGSNTSISTSAPFTKADPSDLLLGSSSLSLATLATGLKYLSPLDPQDHSRLRHAWEEMLSDRFLTPNLITILPFHLRAWFNRIQTHLPLEVPLPLSSSCKQSTQPTPGLPGLINPDTLFELRALSLTAAPEPNNESTCSTIRKSSHTGVSLWASMHLARTVRTIMACKESIWQAYKKLYGHDSLIPSLVRSAPKNYLGKNFDRVQSTMNPLRDYFERDWINWEKKPPEQCAWFNSSPASDNSEYEERPELCRRLRRFITSQSGAQFYAWGKLTYTG
ncbi:hypothetical protein V8E55_003282 [Tylopilus felleus]